MIEKKPDSFSDIVDRAMGELRGSPVPPGPPPQLLDTLLHAAKSNTGTVPSAETAVSPSRKSGPRHRGWSVSRSVIAGLAVATSLLLMVTAGFVLLNYAAGRTFAQMVEEVKAASSVRFATAARFGKQPEIRGVMYLEGHRVRFEQFEGKLVQIGDLDREQALILDTQRKVAQTLAIDAKIARDLVRFADPIEQLRRLKARNAQRIGEEILNGRRTHVYRLREVDLLDIKGGAASETLLWVDAESELPAKIVIRDPDPASLMEFRFEHFAWNEPLERRLFSLVVPDGYRTGVIATMPAPPKPVAPAANPGYLADGILSRDLVPAQIFWGPEGETITALMRDREGVPPPQMRPDEMRQWAVATGKLLWKTDGGIRQLAATADRKVLATVVGFELQLRDAASGKIIRKWATGQYVSPLAFSPDGKTLAAGIAEWGEHGGRGGKEHGGVQIWEIERPRLLRTIPDDKPNQFVAYSVDGKYLATSSGESVKLWDPATGEPTRIFPGIFRAAFSPDGRSIACPAAGRSAKEGVGRVDLYNLRDGSLVKSFLSETAAAKSWLTCITFSADGRLLAAADWNGTVTLWDVTTGQRKLTLTDHQAGVLSVAFAPDTATLATGSEDQTLRLRKLPSELVVN